MKKFILSAAAVAALAVGGVAQADVIDGVGNTISRLFGVPYDPTPANAAPIVNVYTDAHGRHFQVDSAGRHMPLDRYGSYRDQWGRTVYLGANNQPFYVEQNGRLSPYGNAAGSYAQAPSYDPAPSYDRDRDGVADRYDRAPNDPRYR
ncbi:MAG: hypothetical protein EOO24_19140 [Comamonadaceae bacterium]|nr:MAG: hypothetical protein EOO24_19140 [Comamonadaceae bacterium]